MYFILDYSNREKENPELESIPNSACTSGNSQPVSRVVVGDWRITQTRKIGGNSISKIIITGIEIRKNSNAKIVKWSSNTNKKKSLLTRSTVIYWLWLLAYFTLFSCIFKTQTYLFNTLLLKLFQFCFWLIKILKHLWLRLVRISTSLKSMDISIVIALSQCLESSYALSDLITILRQINYTFYNRC